MTRSGFFWSSRSGAKEAGQARPGIEPGSSVVEPEQVSEIDVQAAVGIELETGNSAAAVLVEVTVAEVVLAVGVGLQTLVIGWSGASLQKIRFEGYDNPPRHWKPY